MTKDRGYNKPFKVYAWDEENEKEVFIQGYDTLEEAQKSIDRSIGYGEAKEDELYIR